MRALFHRILVTLVIASSVRAGMLMTEEVPVDSSLDGYSDQSKAVFRECLTGLRRLVAALRVEAESDSKIAAVLTRMQSHEIGRRATKYNDRLQPTWTLLWPKPGFTNDDTGPISVMIAYNDEGLPDNFRHIAEGIKYQWLDVAPANKVAVVYRIHIEDAQARDKVRDALASAFSTLHDAQKK